MMFISITSFKKRETSHKRNITVSFYFGTNKMLCMDRNRKLTQKLEIFLKIN